MKLVAIVTSRKIYGSYLVDMKLKKVVVLPHDVTLVRRYAYVKDLQLEFISFYLFSLTENVATDETVNVRN
jgi:hypothetical protein